MSAKNISTEKVPSDLGMSGPGAPVGKARPDKSPVMDIAGDPITRPMSGKLTPGRENINKKYAPGGGSSRGKS
jgi:hypothetical protein